MLKFLDYFLGIDSEIIPKNSIIREFIGGSCLKVIKAHRQKMPERRYGHTKKIVV